MIKKCAWCGNFFDSTLEFRVYCSKSCRKKGEREHNNNRSIKYYYTHKQYKKNLGTQNRGMHMEESFESEQDKILKEKNRLKMKSENC